MLEKQVGGPLLFVAKGAGKIYVERWAGETFVLNGITSSCVLERFDQALLAPSGQSDAVFPRFPQIDDARLVVNGSMHGLGAIEFGVAERGNPSDYVGSGMGQAFRWDIQHVGLNNF